MGGVIIRHPSLPSGLPTAIAKQSCPPESVPLNVQVFPFHRPDAMVESPAAMPGRGAVALEPTGSPRATATTESPTHHRLTTPRLLLKTSWLTRVIEFG